MQKFVRGNMLVISGTFTPVTGTAQPTSAEAVLVFTDPNGDEKSSVVPLAADVDGVWSGPWDTRECGGGTVDWVLRSDGPVKAATQGRFQVVANDANIAAYD